MIPACPESVRTPNAAPTLHEVFLYKVLYLKCDRNGHARYCDLSNDTYDMAISITSFTTSREIVYWYLELLTPYDVVDSTPQIEGTKA